MDNKDLCEHTKIRLIAAAIGHQQCTKTAANVIQLPGTERFITIGTPAEVRELLELAPMGEASIGVLDAIDSLAGKDIALIAAFETERFYLADDVDGLIARCRRQAALQQLVDQAQERCPHCDDTGDVHSPTGEWRGACTCPEGAADSEGGHHD